MKAAGGEPDDYLECNGQTVDSSKYPKLVKIMTVVPNYEGLFLRGRGGNAAAVGQVQGDAIRNIYGTFGIFSDHHGITATNAFYVANIYDGSHSDVSGSSYVIGLDASRIVPTDAEDRPINTAIIYLILAR